MIGWFTNKPCTTAIKAIGHQDSQHKHLLLLLFLKVLACVHRVISCVNAIAREHWLICFTRFSLYYLFISTYFCLMLTSFTCFALQYSAVDSNPLSIYVMHPFWNFVVKVRKPPVSTHHCFRALDNGIVCIVVSEYSGFAVHLCLNSFYRPGWLQTSSHLQDSCSSC